MTSGYSTHHSLLGSPGDALVAACGNIVVINLPERQDRRDEFADQLHRIGLSFEHPHVHLFEAARPQEAGPFPTIGARGCFLSHLGVLRMALEQRAEKILICEDDLNFSRDFPHRAAYLTAEIEKQEWDILYGFTGEETAGPTVDTEQQLVILSSEQNFQCTHIIAFRQRALRKLVPYLEAMLARPAGDPAGGPMHVDGAYYWFRKDHPYLRALAIRPDIGFQRSSMTNVAAPSVKDHLPGLRQAIAFARKVRNWTVSR